MKKLSDMSPMVFEPLSVQDIKNLLVYQPLAVSLNTPACFKSYSSGVLREKDCACTSTNYEAAVVNHSAVLVGYSASMLTLGCPGHWIV